MWDVGERIWETQDVQNCNADPWMLETWDVETWHLETGDVKTQDAGGWDMET